MIFKDQNLEEQLTSEGYVVVPFLDAEEVSRLADFFKETGKRFNSGLHATMFVKDPEYRKKVDNAIKAVFQKSCEKYFQGYRQLYANFMVKEPGPESDFPVHQDWSYVEEDENRSVAIWVPLMDVKHSNGALQIIERSHNLIRTPRGPGLKSPFEDLYSVIKEKFLTTIPMKAGEALIWDHGLVHCSPPNWSGITRLAATVIMVPEKAQVIHYARNSNQPLENIEKFIVDTDFYMNYNIEDRPVNVESLGISKIEIPSLTLEQLEKHCLKTSNGKLPPTYQIRSKEVADYYDEWNERYKEVYGEIIQAYRPEQTDTLLNHILEKALLADGQAVLDAGCGNCGPATYFAQKINLKIEGLTISPMQVQEAEQKISAANLSEKISVRLGDYHEMDQIYPPEHFERVLFLESLGHAGEPHQVLNAAWKVLKPGGYIYIKDFYFKTPNDKALNERIQEIVKNINRLYSYNCLSLEDTISTLRHTGFEIDFIQRFKDFENTKVRAEFESRFGIDIYGGGEEFYFSEWLEILCQKPSADKNLGI